MMIHLSGRAKEWLANGCKTPEDGYVSELGDTACGSYAYDIYDICAVADVRAMVKLWKNAYVWNSKSMIHTRREIRHPTCSDCAVALDTLLENTESKRAK